MAPPIQDHAVFRSSPDTLSPGLFTMARFLLRPLATDTRNFTDQTGRFGPGFSVIAAWRNVLSELRTTMAIALPKPSSRRTGTYCLPSFPCFCRVAKLGPVSALISISAFAHHDSGFPSGLGRGAIRNLVAVAMPRHQGAPLAAVGAPALSRPLRTRFPRRFPSPCRRAETTKGSP